MALKICGKNKIHMPTSVCPDPTAKIVGVVDATVMQGTDFDLLAGVRAMTNEGVEIPFTVAPSEFVPCDAGEQVFVYEAEGALPKMRTITVTRMANPAIEGDTSTLAISIGEDFDPLDGITATDGNGNPLTVTVVLDDTPNLLTENGVVITDENNEPIMFLRNLITYPWADTTKTASGITFTDNGDRTLTVSGTASDVADFELIDNASPKALEAGTYTLSATGDADVTVNLFAIGSGGMNPVIASANLLDDTFTLSETKQVYATVSVMMTASVDNTITPQLYKN